MKSTVAPAKATPPDHPVKASAIILILAATLSTSSALLAAGKTIHPAGAILAFVKDYRPAGLMNGCLPEAFIFYDAFRQRFPEAKAEVVLLELPDGNTTLYGHAVVVLRLETGLFIWDHEAGIIPIDAPAFVNGPTLRTAVARSYLTAIEQMKARLRAGELRNRSANVAAGQELCLLAARLLVARQPELIEYRTARRVPRQAVAFTGGGLVWLYMPETGTAFAPIQPGCSAVQQVLAALRSSLPQAEIVQCIPVPATNHTRAAL